MAKPGFFGRMVLRSLGVKSGVGEDVTLAEYIQRLSTQRESATGLTVNADTALRVTTAARCAQVLADGIATIPCRIMRKVGTDFQEAPDHPLNSVLGLAANRWQTGLNYRETVGFHIALSPGHFAVKIKNSKKQVIELWPLVPGSVSVIRPDRFGDPLKFNVKTPDGKTIVMSRDDLWYVPGVSWNSIHGLDPVDLGREALGLAMATEQHHAKLHKNGSRPGGLYSIEGTLGPEDYEALQKWIEKNVEGVDNAFKTLILDRAAKFTPMSMTGVDSEHLATRRHQIEEVCRLMGVLPIMVGHANEQTTFASAEQMFLAHQQHTIRPLQRRIEAAIDADLLSAEDRKAGLCAQFYDDELMRANLEAQAKYFTTALGAGGAPGWMTQNEVRARKGLPPAPDGNALPRSAAEISAASKPAPTAPGVSA